MKPLKHAKRLAKPKTAVVDGTWPERILVGFSDDGTFGVHFDDRVFFLDRRAAEYLQEALEECFRLGAS